MRVVHLCLLHFYIDLYISSVFSILSILDSRNVGPTSENLIGENCKLISLLFSSCCVYVAGRMRLLFFVYVLRNTIVSISVLTVSMSVYHFSYNRSWVSF